MLLTGDKLQIISKQHRIMPSWLLSLFNLKSFGKSETFKYLVFFLPNSPVTFTKRPKIVENDLPTANSKK